MSNLLSIVAVVLGIAGGGAGIVTGIVNLVYMRRQTLSMEAQVDRQIEVKITKDLDTPDGVIDSKLRAFLNRRLGDMRGQMRQEFSSGLDEIKGVLQDARLPERRDMVAEAVRLVNDQKDAAEIVKASSGKLNEVEGDIRSLQQAVGDIRRGVENEAMVRAQIRKIAEQLLQMAGSAQPYSDSPAAHSYVWDPESSQSSDTTAN